MQKGTKFSLVAAPIAVAALLLAGAPAQASSLHSSAPSAAHTSTSSIKLGGGDIEGDGYVIVDPGTATTSGASTFYPIASGPVDADTLIVIPDAQGNLPGGLTTTNLKSVVTQLHSKGTAPAGVTAKLADSDTTAVSTRSTSVGDGADRSGLYAWTSTSNGYSGNFAGQSIIGTTASTTVTYSFYTAAGYAQTAAGQGKGHYTGYNGSTFGLWTTYYGLGTAGTGGTSHSVPWGNVADNAGFEAWCATPGVCFGNFYN